MNSYFETHKKSDCNGCGACALRCPKKAIEMVEDDEGFLYPKIDEDKCINCGLCKRICIGDNNSTYQAKTYIAINKNKEDLNNSSSGGLFIAIAKYIISNGGVVFGVEYDENLNAQHNYCEVESELKRFQGSKYVRSNLNNSYTKVEIFLKSGRYVLFTGTPCQCQGLKKYLQKDYDNLIVCDIVCHANPSKKIYNMYKKNLENTNNSKIVSISFRDKNTGWRCQTPTIILENGEKIQDTAYLYAFLNELINRPSCYNCSYCTEKRYTDITIGDMWGAEKINKKYEGNDTGISLLNINSEKGNIIFEKISPFLDYEEVDTSLAFSFNHNHNVKPNKNREVFFNKVKNKEIDETNIPYYLRKYVKKNILIRILNRIKYLFKKAFK